MKQTYMKSPAEGCFLRVVMDFTKEEVRAQVEARKNAIANGEAARADLAELTKVLA